MQASSESLVEPRGPGAPRPTATEERIRRAIEDFQSGKERERSFRTLFDAYSGPVRRFFARKGLPEDVCRELSQETFLGIYRGLETWRPEARFETWLYRIATTTYLKMLRSKRAEKRSGEEISTDDSGVESSALAVDGEQLQVLLDAERRAALRAALERLPEKMRQCLTLRLHHGLGYREIATVMGLSPETVKAHLYQARGKLREWLGP